MATSTSRWSRPTCKPPLRPACRERRPSSSTAASSPAPSRSKRSSGSSTKSCNRKSRGLRKSSRFGTGVAKRRRMPLLDQLSAQLDRLAEWDPGPFPVVSLYLNLQADDKGRDNFEPFLRKELSDRIATYGVHGPERDSLATDADKIRQYVDTL